MVSLEPTHSVNFNINCEQTTFFGSKQRVCEPINLLWDTTGFLWDPDMYWSCFFDDSMQTCGTTTSAHVQKEIRNTQKNGKDNFALGSKVLRLSWPPNCSSIVQGTSDAHLTLWNDQSKTPMMQKRHWRCTCNDYFMVWAKRREKSIQRQMYSSAKHDAIEQIELLSSGLIRIVRFEPANSTLRHTMPVCHTFKYVTHSSWEGRLQVSYLKIR